MNYYSFIFFILLLVLLFLYFNYINKKSKHLIEENSLILKEFGQILVLFNQFKNEIDFTKKMNLLNSLRTKLYNFQTSYSTKSFEKEINLIEEELYEFMKKNNID
ncbi:MAG: hypothetical protein N3A58_03605 [Spirochaetes bacterium]|nr:hypothetical protein [Spirochaetota bacterium]